MIRTYLSNILVQPGVLQARASIASLPPELICLILINSPCLSDLRNALHASSLFVFSYVGNEGRILRKILNHLFSNCKNVDNFVKGLVERILRYCHRDGILK